MEYEFMLTFRLQKTAAELDELVERLWPSCSDALVGIGRSGYLALDFTRTAESADLAIVSALADVEHAIPDAHLVEVS